MLSAGAHTFAGTVTQAVSHERAGTVAASSGGHVFLITLGLVNLFTGVGLFAYVRLANLTLIDCRLFWGVHDEVFAPCTPCSHLVTTLARCPLDSAGVARLSLNLWRDGIMGEAMTLAELGSEMGQERVPLGFRSSATNPPSGSGLSPAGASPTPLPPPRRQKQVHRSIRATGPGRPAPTSAQPTRPNGVAPCARNRLCGRS